MDGDSSDDELEDEVEEEEEDFDPSREMKGIDLASEYSVERPRTEELLRLAPLFPELSNYKVPSGSVFRDAVMEARKG